MAGLTISIGSIIDSPSNDNTVKRKQNHLTVEINDENCNNLNKVENPQTIVVKDSTTMVGHSPGCGNLFKNLTSNS